MSAQLKKSNERTSKFSTNKCLICDRSFTGPYKVCSKCRRERIRKYSPLSEEAFLSRTRINVEGVDPGKPSDMMKFLKDLMKSIRELEERAEGLGGAVRVRLAAFYLRTAEFRSFYESLEAEAKRPLIRKRTRARAK